MLSVVLEYKNRSGLYKSGVQDFDRNFAEPRHVVGRIGEDDVVRSRCRLDEAENVATDQREIIGFELFGNLFDESLLRGGFLDGSHMRTLPGKELEADGPRAGEQVKGAQTFEIDDVLKNVEYIFAGEVGGRPRSDIGRDVEATPSVFSTDYSHKGRITNGNGAERA